MNDLGLKELCDDIASQIDAFIDRLEKKFGLKDLRELFFRKKGACKCGKKAVWNFPEKEWGTRCMGHKEEGMINVHTKEAAANRFKKNIEKQGTTMLGVYKDNRTPVKCICPMGHECFPRPTHIQQGHGMCSTCSGNNSEVAKRNFIESIKEMRATILGIYNGAFVPVKCICPMGHECFPIPNSIQQGQGMCLTCVGKDPEIAKRNFIESIKEMKATMLGVYKDSKTPVKCICPMGHECFPVPSVIQQGNGMCGRCMMCPSCGLWRTKGVLCAYCKPTKENKLYFKTKEMDVVRFLRDRLPDEEFIHNKSVGSECTDGHLFPDILYDKVWYNLIVEVDEHKHRGSAYSCDERRMYDIIAKVGRPCIFVRYNPDSKESNKEILLEMVKRYLDLDDNDAPWDKYGFKVEYLFY